MKRIEMIKLLIEDFKRTNPSADHMQMLALFIRLDRLADQDLELLVSQVDKQAGEL